MSEDFYFFMFFEFSFIASVYACVYVRDLNRRLSELESKNVPPDRLNKVVCIYKNFQGS